MKLVLKDRSEDAIHKVRAMQKERKFSAHPIQKDATLFSILNDIPYFTAMMRRLNDIGIATDRLSTMTGSTTPEMLEITRNLPLVNLATRALDFIQIPFIYLIYFVMGKKAPITLKNNSRWLYAAVIFGLLLTAVTAPITAPFIAVIVAFTILAVTTLTLAQILQQYRVDQLLLAELNTSINTEMRQLELIQHQAKELGNKLLDTKSDKAAVEIISTIDELNLQYTTKTNFIQTLYDKRHECEEKQKIETTVMNKCFMIFVYGLTTIGAILAFLFPPVGLAIMITAGFINAAFALSQITLILLNKTRSEQVIEDTDTNDLDESTPEILIQIADEDTLSKPIASNDKEDFAIAEDIPEAHPIESPNQEEQPQTPNLSNRGG